MKLDIHVLLVSAQAAPNLLAALDPELRPKKAILLVSRKMAQKAADLEAVLNEANVATQCVALENEHDLNLLEEVILGIAAENSGKLIALNVTGGTKLMALAAQAVASAANWPVFYVDIDTDEIIWLDKSENPRKISATLRLPHYLRSYGFSPSPGLDRPIRTGDYDNIFRTLIPQLGSLEKPLGQLNFLSQKAEDEGRLAIPLSNHQLNDPHLSALLRLFEEAAILKVTASGAVFADKPALTFLKGGWLEHYVYRAVTSLHGELSIRDKAANLKVTDSGAVINELDVAFLARNRLFVIECKTARMDSERSTKANDTLFKLAEISRRVGGLGTRSMLTSYRALRDAELRLAKALEIETVCGIELAKLDERIRRWVKK